MHRIDADAHVSNLFDEGDPGVPREPTQVDADWLNAVQEEICNLITANGTALVKGTNTQLRDALLAGVQTLTSPWSFTGGLLATGGASSFGHGIITSGKATGGKGVFATGVGANEAVYGVGGATGAGVVGVGGATSGAGGTFSGGTLGDGVVGTGVGTGKVGVRGTGANNATGYGVYGISTHASAYGVVGAAVSGGVGARFETGKSGAVDFAAVDVSGTIHMEPANTPAGDTPLRDVFSALMVPKAVLVATLRDALTPVVTYSQNVASFTQATDGSMLLTIAQDMATDTYGAIVKISGKFTTEETFAAGTLTIVPYVADTGSAADDGATNGRRITVLLYGAQ